MAEVAVVKSQLPSGDPDMKGWLFKWTNYLKGYQRRWFVLSNGLLSYYRNQAEVAHTCRGTITLMGALIHTVDSCTFVISNGGTQTFHIKAANEVDRQNWVTALELAKAKAIRATESDDDDVNSMGNGGIRSMATQGGVKIPDDGAPRELAVRLDDLRTCAELVVRHGNALQRALAELDIPQSEQSRQASERATLFRIACNGMMNASADFLQVAQSAGPRWSRMLQHERDQKTRLQEVVEQLARQHDTLEKSVTARATSQPSESTHDTDDEEHEFFDAQDGGSFSAISTGEENSFIIKIPVKANRKNSAYDESSEESENGDDDNVTETQVLFVREESESAGNLDGQPCDKMSPTITDDEHNSDHTDNASGELFQSIDSNRILNHRDAKDYKIWPHAMNALQSPGVKSRRHRVPDKPNYTLNLWSILKNCIGKELSKIPIPVNFSEPLSMLQRLAEDYEYSSILDMAARCTDPCEQLAYLAAFTISSYATTAYRTAKPFNPLLGETYECDRMDDLGWRSIAEQVSHHPPMLAQYCQGVSGWNCWQEFTFTSKFRGKYIQLIPLGSATAEFKDSGNKYSWRKVTTTVHNVIVGKLWVDQHGDMDIIGEGAASGVQAHIKYLPYSYFSKDAQRKVTGVVKNAFGQPKYVIQGYWDKRVEIAPVTGTNSDSSVCKTGKFVTAWEKMNPAPDSERFYNFSVLAAQLNEPEVGVAPTDSRLRPDQRLMEEGLWDEANTEKLRLEEEQRTRRRQLETVTQESAEKGLPRPQGHMPIWFRHGRLSDLPDAPLRHIFTDDYWTCKEKQDWSRCPNIF